MLTYLVVYSMFILKLTVAPFNLNWELWYKHCYYELWRIAPEMVRSGHWDQPWGSMSIRGLRHQVIRKSVCCQPPLYSKPPPQTLGSLMGNGNSRSRCSSFSVGIIWVFPCNPCICIIGGGAATQSFVQSTLQSDANFGQSYYIITITVG